MKKAAVQPDETKSKLPKKAQEIIWSELSLEQWVIWRPSNSHQKPKVRVLKREIILPDGSKATSSLKIVPSVLGDPTTEDQKMMWALIKQWEAQGRPETHTSFSLQQLARLLKKKWGTRAIETITKSLMRLNATSFYWGYSYYDSATKEFHKEVADFRFLDRLKIVQRSQDGNITYQAGYFRFHDLMLINLKNNHTKPVLYDIAISFKSEIAQLIYSQIDRLMWDKNQYERRTKGLFDDLGLEGKAYVHASKRKQVLQPALKELTGKPLTTGRISSATLETTKDGTDYKVVFRKGARDSQVSIVAASQPPVEGSGQSDNTQTKAAEQAIDLVKYFFHLFFGVDNAVITPNSRPSDQAAQLIARHGYDQAKYIVDFAKRVAPETGFEIQTFGGILQYEARAIAEYENHLRHQHQRDHQAAEEFERMRLEEEHTELCRRAIDAYIAEHRDEMPRRLEATRQDEIKKWPTRFNAWTEDAIASFIERMVRNDIARELNLPDFDNYYEQRRSREVDTQPSDETGK